MMLFVGVLFNVSVYAADSQTSVFDSLCQKFHAQLESLSNQKIIHVENIQREFADYFHLAQGNGVPVERWIQLRGRDSKTEAFLTNDGILDYIHRRILASREATSLGDRLVPVSDISMLLGSCRDLPWFIVEHKWEHLHIVLCRVKNGVREFFVVESGPWDHGHGWNHDTLRAIKSVYPESPVYIFKHARQRDQYSCRAMLLLDLEAHLQHSLWSVLDNMQAKRPDWIEHTEEGFSILRWHPPSMMKVSQSLRFLETYLESKEVEAFFGQEELTLLGNVVDQHMRVIMYQNQPKKCNFFLSMRLMEQLVTSAIDLLEQYSIK